IRRFGFAADIVVHARALLTVLLRGRLGESYNIGGNAEATNIDIVRAICAILDELHPDGAPRDRLIRFVTDRPGHDFRYAIDASKIRSELGWEPSVTLDQGLRQTVAWYLDNEPWWRAIQARGHEMNRIGLKQAQGRCASSSSAPRARWPASWRAAQNGAGSLLRPSAVTLRLAPRPKAAPPPSM